jgi:hypothetical protein
MEKIETTFIGVDYKQLYTTHLALWLGNLSGNVYLDDFKTTITGNNLITISNYKGKSIETISETGASVMLYPQPIRSNTPSKLSALKLLKTLAFILFKRAKCMTLLEASKNSNRQFNDGYLCVENYIV